MIKPFVIKLWKWYKGHDGISDAHHTKYTDAEAVDAVEDSGGIDIEGATNPMVAVHDTNQATRDIKIGVVQSGANSYPGLWLAQVTPTAFNFSFLGGSTYTLFNSPGGYIAFRIAGANKMKLYPSGGFAIGDSFYSTDPGTDNVTIEKNLGIRTTAPTLPLDIVAGLFRLRNAYTPTSASATGQQGSIGWDTNYVYVCVATNTWKRVAIGTW